MRQRRSTCSKRIEPNWTAVVRHGFQLTRINEIDDVEFSVLVSEVVAYRFHGDAEPRPEANTSIAPHRENQIQRALFPCLRPQGQAA
jgi:hypothetical protein